MDQNADIVDVLRREMKAHQERINYHQDQLAKINTALAALGGVGTTHINNKTPTATTDTNKVSWAKEIRSIFDSEKGPLSIGDIKSKLDAKGLSDPEDQKHKSIVSNTVIRLAKGRSAFIKKVSPGVYRKKTSRPERNEGDFIEEEK